MRLLGIEGVQGKVPYSRSQLWRLIKKGRFPAPLKIGGKALWPEHEVDDLIRSLIARRDGKATE